jgi:hypothetical protein
VQSGVLPESLPVARICIKMVEMVPNRLTMILSGIYYTLKGFFKPYDHYGFANLELCLNTLKLRGHCCKMQSHMVFEYSAN